MHNRRRTDDANGARDRKTRPPPLSSVPAPLPLRAPPPPPTIVMRTFNKSRGGNLNRRGALHDAAPEEGTADDVEDDAAASGAAERDDADDDDDDEDEAVLAALLDGCSGNEKSESDAKKYRHSELIYARLHVHTCARTFHLAQLLHLVHCALLVRLAKVSVRRPQRSVVIVERNRGHRRLERGDTSRRRR